MEERPEVDLETVSISCGELTQMASLLDRNGAVVWTNDVVLARTSGERGDGPDIDGSGVPNAHVEVPVHLANHRRATLRLAVPRHPDPANDDMFVVRETQHRARNLLSLVMAIASQSFVDRTLDPATRKFIDRLASLDSVIRVGCEARGDLCPVPTIVAQVTQRFEDPDRPQFRLEGDNVALPARWAHTLALVLHELATNAIRHGALRDPKGWVGVVWHRNATPDGEAVFDVEWREHMTTPAVSSIRKGFGTRMLRAAIDTHRNCSGSMAMLPTGLIYKWTLRLPAADLPLVED